MIIGKRRAILFAVIAGIAIAIITLPLITLTLAPAMDKVEITLSNVTIDDIIEQNDTIDLVVSFGVLNPTDNALTTSKIDYKLFADDTLIGEDTLSFEDIPLNGRPQFFPQDRNTLRDDFRIRPNTENQQIVNRIMDSQTLGDINWRMEGNAQIESAFSMIQKPFSSSLENR